MAAEKKMTRNFIELTEDLRYLLMRGSDYLSNKTGQAWQISRLFLNGIT